MAVPPVAAPPTPGSMDLAAPQISGAADVHPLAQVTGNVQLHRNVVVAPGSSIKADEGASFWIGEGSHIQSGVVIRGLPQGQVLGDDQIPYSVWIGPHSSITHKVLIQGPAYIGEGCFVGFRSTILNARLGQGCIVMMHALIQDVEIPPGKMVSSGMVITRQEQAEQLPDVQPSDLAFAREVLGGGAALLSDSHYTNLKLETGSHGVQHSRLPGQQPGQQYSDGLSTMQSQRLTSEIVQQVRQFLSQGYQIGTEHADARRFRSNVWQTCSPIQSRREGDVLGALEACLAEHSGEYVRMFGIDPVAKKRMAPVTIQRPGGQPLHIETSQISSPAGASASQPRYNSVAASNGSLPTEVVQQVRQLLSQGYHIGTEHADTRRYRSNVWQTCSPIQSNRESEVMAALQQCLADHSGEYVRLFGIEPKAKRRVSSVTIQRPDGKPVEVSTHTVPPANSGSQTSRSGSSLSTPRGSLRGEVVQQVRQLVNQGYRLGIEYADTRRYRSNVWQTCAPVKSAGESAAFAALESCLAEHPNDYVRIFGIDSRAKQRVGTTTIQRPGDKPADQSVPASVPLSAAATNGHAGGGTTTSKNGASQGVSSDVAQQVNQLVNQGYRIGLEHADVRRYRSGAWQNAGYLEGNRTADVLATLEARLQEHNGEYVRLIGIDPQAKRRVLETTIQRP